MKHLALAMVLAAALAGCASTPTVNTDFDPSVQFSNFRSYAWVQKPQGSNPLVEQRIVTAVDAQLQARGWRLVDQNTADIGLVGNVTTQQRQSIDTFYSGPAWGGWGWYRGGWGPGAGGSTTTVRTYNVGTLVIDMFDMKTRQAVWRATASSTVSSTPDRNNTQVQAAVDRMFAEFPPGSAPAK